LVNAWQPRGLLLHPLGGRAWARSHVALPTPTVDRRGGRELYFSPRDEQGRAHVARARIAVQEDTLRVVAVDDDPVLSPGPAGAFDESGVTVSCVVEAEAGTFLYYTGWTLGRTVPFYFYAGLAVRPPGEADFRRVSPAPLLDRSAVDPFLTASPWVISDEQGWRMWYVSSPGWRVVDGDPQHLYHVRYAESDDGVSWRRDGRVCIDFAHDGEYAMGRACVVRDPDRYRMWFAARGDAYRLAYAESQDGLTWIRDDASLELSGPAAEWEDGMRAYPAVFDHGHRRFLLYNGNGYGRTGIGYAVAPRSV
jgi:hypothetical protein